MGVFFSDESQTEKSSGILKTLGPSINKTPLSLTSLHRRPLSPIPPCFSVEAAAASSRVHRKSKVEEAIGAQIRLQIFFLSSFPSFPWLRAPSPAIGIVEKFMNKVNPCFALFRPDPFLSFPATDTVGCGVSSLG